MQMISGILVYILLLIPVSVIINYFLKPAFRPCFLLVASLILIGLVSPQALITVLFSSTINFLLYKKVKGSALLFYAGILFNVALIMLANYIVHFKSGPEWKLIDFNFRPVLVTIGLSFYSVQHIACLVDCRRGVELKAGFIHFLFGSVYFPKFLAGPIAKHSMLLGQVGNKMGSENLLSGFNRLLLGLFKKMVIADRLFTHVHSVFDFDSHYPGLTMFIGSLLFTIQLYFDFSGYTDMALGISEMLGFKLPENFNMPFRSLSISDFWRRWHISLISFFTEYIYNPIAFSLRRFKYLSAAAGIFVTFLISGIWHGIGLSFIFWALCHMFALQYELFSKKIRAGVPSFITNSFGWLLTMIVVIVSNYFFRSSGSNLPAKFIEASKNFLPNDFISETLAPLAVGGHQINYFNFYLSVSLALIYLIFEQRLNMLGRRNTFSILYTVVFALMILVFGVFANTEQFIYVQF